MRLATWTSHKTVHAGRIKEIGPLRTLAGVSGRSLAVESDQPGTWASFFCDASMFVRYFPQIGDFLVVYDQGEPSEYTSISPAKAFEDGYHAGSEPISVFQNGNADARESDDERPSLFRKRYRKLTAGELAVHDAIKDAAEELAEVIGQLNSDVARKFDIALVTSNVTAKDAGNVTLALRHLEDCVYRAVKALTA